MKASGITAAVVLLSAVAFVPAGVADAAQVNRAIAASDGTTGDLDGRFYHDDHDDATETTDDGSLEKHDDDRTSTTADADGSFVGSIPGFGGLESAVALALVCAVILVRQR